VTHGALVLAGGGVVGIAWELGFLRGLESGSPTLFDRIRSPETTFVGTSAGSIVAAQLASGVSIADLLAPEMAGATAPSGGPRFHLVGMAATMIGARLGTRSPEAARRRIGPYALRAQTFPEDDWVGSIRRRLGSDSWPDRRLLINVVDSESGEHRVFDQSSGVDLARAVAGSCAVPGVYPPVTIDGRRYMDGGMRSIANADVAAGCDPVLIVAPLRGGGGLGTVTRSELDALAPAQVRVEYADRESARAFGRNPLGAATRAASARAGVRQGQQNASEIATFWNQRRTE